MKKTKRRQVVLGLGISLDGYISRPDGSVDFLVMDPDYDWSGFMKTVDVWLLGRKTLEDAMKMGGGFSSPGMTTLVFSQSLKEGKHKRGYWVTRESPAEAVKRLRTEPGKDLWLGGGGELVKSFLEADLVDRLEIGVCPVLIGEGRPLFPPGFPERKFRMIDAKSYPKTGMLTLAYERTR